MAWLLDRYLNFWAWMLWPARAVTRGILAALAEIDIPLIGDIIKVFIACAGLAILWIYVAIFSLVPPVSLFLLGTAVSAVLLRYFSRLWSEKRPIISAWFGSLTVLSGWSSVGFLVLTAANGWLNYFGATQIDPAQFAQYEATAVDATALLRRYVTPTTALIAVGAMAALTLATASLKPIFAAAHVNRAAMAVLTMFAVIGSYTVVVSQDSAIRHERMMGQLMPRLRENIDATLQARQETAALRWITAEMSFRAPADRSSLIRTLAALYNSSQRICAEEQAQFQAAYAVARDYHYQNTYEEVEESSASAAQSYCNATNVSATAIHALVRVNAIEPPAGTTREIWLDDVLADSSPEMRRAAINGAAPDTISIREAQVLEARVQAAASEAVLAKTIVRNALLEYAASAVGPEYRGVIGQIVESLQSAVIRRLATVTQVHFHEFWAPRSAPTYLGDDVSLRSTSPDAELVRWEEAHPSIRGSGGAAADDVARATWGILRPTGGAVYAAEAAVAAAAATALAARGIRPGARTAARGARAPRVPRIRF